MTESLWQQVERALARSQAVEAADTAWADMPTRTAPDALAGVGAAPTDAAQGLDEAAPAPAPAWGGGKLAPILQQFSTLRRGDVVDYARRNKLLPAALDAASVGNIYAALDTELRQQAAYGALGELAQSRPELGFVRRAHAATRAELRGTPGFRNQDLSNAQIVRIYQERAGRSLPRQEQPEGEHLSLLGRVDPQADAIASQRNQDMLDARSNQLARNRADLQALQASMAPSARPSTDEAAPAPDTQPAAAPPEPPTRGHTPIAQAYNEAEAVVRKKLGDWKDAAKTVWAALPFTSEQSNTTAARQRIKDGFTQTAEGLAGLMPPSPEMMLGAYATGDPEAIDLMHNAMQQSGQNTLAVSRAIKKTWDDAYERNGAMGASAMVASSLGMDALGSKGLGATANVAGKAAEIVRLAKTPAHAAQELGHAINARKAAGACAEEIRLLEQAHAEQLRQAQAQAPQLADPPANAVPNMQDTQRALDQVRNYRTPGTQPQPTRTASPPASAQTPGTPGALQSPALSAVPDVNDTVLEAKRVQNTTLQPEQTRQRSDTRNTEATTREPSTEAKPSNLDQANFQENFTSIYNQASAAKIEIDALADEIALRHNGVVAKAPLKSKERAIEKINKFYKGKPQNIKDLARNTIIVDPDRVDAIVTVLGQNKAKVRVIDGSVDPLGYSGVNATLKTKSGIYAEIQVNTPAMIYAKEPEFVARVLLGDDIYDAIAIKTNIPGGLGHKYYEQWRVLDSRTKDAQSIAEKSRVYYDSIRKFYADK